MEDSKYPKVSYRYVVFLSLLMLLAGYSVTAQDPQFSQFYAAPLYLNPAFAGSTNQARVGVNYRNQWPAIDANFTTVSAYFDYYLEDYKSSVGVILNQDREGLAGLRSFSLGVQYGYELKINENLAFRPGIQVALYNRDINFGKLTFGELSSEPEYFEQLHRLVNGSVV